MSFVFCFLALFKSSAFALELGDFDLNFSLSQTYLHTSQNEFMIPKSDQGTFEWTEGVVNTIKRFDRLQIGAQLLVRDFGDEGNFRADLDWGYLDYALRDEIGLRLGRMRLPFGLGNEFRDVDAARMEILMPQVFNPEDFRAAAAAYQGVGLYGTLSSQKLGSLQYHLFYGNNTIHDDFFMVRDARTSFDSPNTSLTTRGLGGGQLSWNTPFEGLKFAYTHLRYEGYFDVEFNHPVLGLVQDGMGLQLNIKWNVLSLEYVQEPWSFSFEYSNRDNDSVYGSTLTPVFGTSSYDDSNTVAYYGTVRRQIDDRLGVYGSYGEVYGNIADDGASLAEYLKEASLGLRYDLKHQVILKAQASQMRGYRGALSGTGSDWLMFTTRVTWMF